jgi:hypothetical protein
VALDDPPPPTPWQVLAAHGHEFDSTYTCEDIVGTIGQHKPFVLLTLRRDRTHFNPVYVFKHPLAVALKDTQGMLEEREVFAVSAFIQRMKLRTIQWSTGLISGRAESLMRDYVSELELHNSFRLVAGDKVACYMHVEVHAHKPTSIHTRTYMHMPLTLTLSLWAATPGVRPSSYPPSIPLQKPRGHFRVSKCQSNRH